MQERAISKERKIKEEIISKNESNKINSDNFTMSNREMYNIAFAILDSNNFAFWGTNNICVDCITS